MRKKILGIGVTALAVGGMGLATLQLGAPQTPAPFIDPLLLNSSVCSPRGAQTSRKAFFLRIGAAHAQAERDEVAAPRLSSETIKKMAYTITTSHPDAAAWFNQGLAYTFGFNHGAAIDAFRRAQAIDPACGACYWGEAFAHGPNINAPMTEEAVTPAYTALQKARALAANANPREQALIAALGTRYSEAPLADRRHLDAAFAEAMDRAARAFPEDDLIAVIAAEANMDTQPWTYWEAAGRAPAGRTARTIELLEAVLTRNPTYPPAIHLYIHITEASSDPYRAARYADRLADLTPDLGHLVHMPSHTYYRIGRWQQSYAHNVAAVRADETFLARNLASPLYEYGYFTHNIHFAMTSAMMGGDRENALEMARRLDEKLPAEMAAAQAWIQPIKAAPYYAMAQFAEAENILALPDPGATMPFLQAAWHYARAEALVDLERFDEARREADAITNLKARADFTALEAGNVPAKGILDISQHVVIAQVLAGEGDLPGAIRHLEEAVALQNAFPYMEPPYWYYPVRQSLAALVLRNGEAERAVALFMKTLVDSPNNAYAFYGLSEAYAAQGDRAGARHARRMFTAAWLGKRRDRPTLSSL